jgi:FtsP/CotA-like multicopper oxidase with cupredoxin domain
MILIDEGVVYEANHMFHLHGNYFHVVGMDRIGTNVSLEQIKELDNAGKLRRKFTDSVRKDTVTVPDGGYTIIRLYADNPGRKFDSLRLKNT